MSWDNALNTGIETVDMHHRGLVQRVEEFHMACMNNDGNEALSKILAFLDEYILVHFSYEEGLFQSVNYPQREIHINSHKSFIAEVNNIRNRIDNDDSTADIIKYAKDFLMAWLVRHISGMDMDFSVYYKNAMSGTVIKRHTNN